MSEAKRFDPCAIPLEGVNLLEASAGTGKTYSIQNLVLRLLLEKEFPLESILLVTFTRAATAELRGRILKIIHQALLFLSGELQEEEDRKRLGPLLANADPEKSRKLLRKALADFDRASIFTIHGFCQKVLSDQAFESRELFDPAPAGDAGELIDELVRDYMRSLVYGGVAPAGTGKDAKKITLPNASLLAKLLRKKLEREDFRIMDSGANRLLVQGVDELCGRLETYKKTHHLRFFSDLISDLHRKLRGEDASPEMVALLREKYPAAIVDEFQDVDAKQYEIFETIFIRRPDPVFFMVGDVKQSIYGFRGGDAQAMFHAAEAAEAGGARYHLPDNYRSTPALVNEVNRLFARHDDPFLDRKIRFTPVGGKSGALPLQIDGKDDGFPLRISYRSSRTDHPVSSVGALKEQCFIDCAAAIAKLLSPESAVRIMPENRPIRPSDVAVLALTNASLDEMGEVLTKFNIPFTRLRQGNVFDTPEARSLDRMLDALLDAGNPSATAAALNSGFCDISCPELVRLNDSGEIGEYLDFFRSAAEENEAADFSFVRLFDRLAEKFDLKLRLLREDGNSRRLVNYLHLADLLQEKASREKLKLPGVAEYLKRQLDPETRVERDDQKMRLENAGESVSLLTVHGSKGLEFNIVMLPDIFAKDCLTKKNSDAPCRDENGLLYIDLDYGKEFIRRASHDLLAEQLRLLYVALTRAKYRTCLFWGDSDPSRSRSALEYLFCGQHLFENGDEPENEDCMETLKERLAVMIPFRSADRVKFATNGENKRSLLLENGMFTPGMLMSLPSENDRIPIYRGTPETEEPVFAPWRGKIDRAWRYWSYSSLTAAPEKETSAGADYDDAPRTESAAVERDEAGSGGIFALPGGARLGNAWHKILENTDFTRIATAEKIAPRILREYAFHDPGALDLTLQMIRDLCQVPLPGGFRFGSLSRRDTLRELEFNCRLDRRLDAVTLFRRMEERYGGNYGEGQDCRGMFCGFIDLLARAGEKFYIVDWKSNSLGGIAANFRRERLDEAMRRGRYHLQYMIYCAVFVKFYRLRFGKFDREDYERSFGGVYYVFLRGVRADDPESGIYFDRPDYDFLMETEAAID